MIGRLGKVCLIICLTGGLLFTASCKRQIKKTTVPVNPVQEEKSNIEAFGTVKVKEVQNIHLDFPVKVQTVHVKEGQVVNLGEPLITLNIDDFQVQIKSKESELNSARFELLKARKDLQEARESYEKAKRELNAKNKLFQEGAISQHEVDECLDLVKTKEKAVTDIQLSPDSPNSQLTGLKILEEKGTILEYDLKRLKSKLNQDFLKGNLMVSNVANGVIFEVGCSSGDLIYPETEKKVLSIWNLDTIFIQADVAEEFIKDVKIGAETEVVPVADHHKKYRGKVTKISQIAVKQNNETIIPVEILVQNPDRFLRPNFNVDVSISKGKNSGK